MKGRDMHGHAAECSEPHNPIMRWLPSHVPFADVDAGDVGGRAGQEGQTRHVGEAEDCVHPTNNEHKVHTGQRSHNINVTVIVFQKNNKKPKPKPKPKQNHETTNPHQHKVGTSNWLNTMVVEGEGGGGGVDHSV